MNELNTFTQGLATVWSQSELLDEVKIGLMMNFIIRGCALNAVLQAQRTAREAREQQIKTPDGNERVVSP